MCVYIIIISTEEKYEVENHEVETPPVDETEVETPPVAETEVD